MSNTLARSSSSSGVRRSKSKVPRPSRLSAEPTKRLRGLCLLLPLPWAKTTRPLGDSGTVRCPESRPGPMGTSTSSSRRGDRPPPSKARSALLVAVRHALEQRDDLSVARGREVVVELTDGEESHGHLDAHHLVGVAAQ